MVRITKPTRIKAQDCKAFRNINICVGQGKGQSHGGEYDETEEHKSSRLQNRPVVIRPFGSERLKNPDLPVTPPQ